MNEICTVYHEAETVHENGGHTISVDEMTGIQALEHKYPDKPVTPGKAAHMEFEYIRHGTVSLIGFFDVATRRMEKPYLNSTRTEKDFVEAIRALIETDSEALNNPVPVSLLSGDRKPQIRFLGNHHSGSGNLYYKSFRM